jgi:hypothetical protein
MELRSDSRARVRGIGQSRVERDEAVARDLRMDMEERGGLCLT